MANLLNNKSAIDYYVSCPRNLTLV